MNINEMTTTKNLHILATIAHIISGTILCFLAAQRGWLIANEFLTAFSHAIGIGISILYESNQDTNDIPYQLLDTPQNSNKNIDAYKKLEYTRRWIEYAVTAGLLEVAILRTDDVYQIVTILALNAVLQSYGWILDVEKKMRMLILFGFGVLAVEISFIASWSPEPWWTLLIYALYYSLFGLIQLLHVYDVLPFDEDHIYTLLSITTKIVLTWTLVSHDMEDMAMEVWVNCLGVFFLSLGAGLLWRRTGRQVRF